MPDFKTLSQSLLLPITQQFTLPQSLIYFVTSRCNAGCEFCLYYDQLNNTDKAHVELTAGEVRKITEQYGHLHYLGISGGEPFIRKDLAELCQAFADHCGVQVIDIPSNFYYGERMVEFVHAFFAKNPNITLDLQFSLDNLGSKHDESRKIKGLFEKAIQNFKTLYALKTIYPNLMMKVNLVYLPSNKHELQVIISQLCEMISFDRLQLTYPHRLIAKENKPDAETLDDLQHYFTLAQQADLTGHDAGRTDLYALGLRSVKKIYRQLLQQAITGVRNTGAYCQAGKNIVVMNEAGDIFPCEMLWHEKTGNVRQYDYSIKKVLANRAYQAFSQKYLGKGGCNCTWSCAMNTEVSVNYRYFPQLAVNAFSLLLNHKK